MASSSNPLVLVQTAERSMNALDAATQTVRLFLLFRPSFPQHRILIPLFGCTVLSFIQLDSIRVDMNRYWDKINQLASNTASHSS